MRLAVLAATCWHSVCCWAFRMASGPARDRDAMKFDASSVGSYFAALFVAWAVGFVVGYVWTWTRKILGDIVNFD